jgi:hypothetical protein
MDNKVYNYNLFKYHNIAEQDILISYMGPFDKVVISKLGKKINILTDDMPKVGKKIFKIFIELAQNVSYYSEEKSKTGDQKENGIGSLIIGESTDQVLFSTGNPVSNDLVPILAKKADIINSLDRESLRKYKIEQRNLVPGSNDGAHIGLIMVALLTRKELDVQFLPYGEDRSYFVVTVKVGKDDTGD